MVGEGEEKEGEVQVREGNKTEREEVIKMKKHTRTSSTSTYEGLDKKKQTEERHHLLRTVHLQSPSPKHNSTAASNREPNCSQITFSFDLMKMFTINEKHFVNEHINYMFHQ